MPFFARLLKPVLPVIAMVLAGLSAPAHAALTAQEIAAFTFTDESGGKRSLADHPAKLIALNLWATWCAPCVEEMPSLSKLQADMGSLGLQVITVSLDGNMKKVNDFYGSHGISNLPAYLDQGMKIFGAVKTEGLPVTVLIKNGEEVKRYSGFVDWDGEAARGELKKLLEQDAAGSLYKRTF